MSLYKYQLSSLGAPLRTCAMVRDEHWQAPMWFSTSRKRGYAGHCTVVGATLFRVVERPEGPPEDMP